VLLVGVIVKIYNIQRGPKLGIQYVVNYSLPTSGPPCMKNARNGMLPNTNGKLLVTYLLRVSSFCNGYNGMG